MQADGIYDGTMHRYEIVVVVFSCCWLAGTVYDAVTGRRRGTSTWSYLKPGG